MRVATDRVRCSMRPQHPLKECLHPNKSSRHMCIRLYRAYNLLVRSIAGDTLVSRWYPLKGLAVGAKQQLICTTAPEREPAVPVVHLPVVCSGNKIRTTSPGVVVQARSQGQAAVTLCYKGSAGLGATHPKQGHVPAGNHTCRKGGINALPWRSKTDKAPVHAAQEPVG